MPKLGLKVKVKAVCKDKDGNIKWIQEIEVDPEKLKELQNDSKRRT